MSSAALVVVLCVQAAWPQPASQTPGSQEDLAALTIGNTITDFIKTTTASDALDGIQGATARQQLLAKQVDRQKATVETAAALSLKPEAPQLLALRAQVYNQLERPQEALKDALHAIVNDPKAAAAWVQKGLAREKLGEPPDKFIPDLQHAAELDPSFQSFYREALARRGQADSKVTRTAGGSEPASFARVLEAFRQMLPDEKSSPWFYRGVWAFNIALLLLGAYLIRRLAKGE